MTGKSRHRLLTLEANAPLTIHLSDSQIQTDIKVRDLILQFKDRSFVVMTSGVDASRLASKILQVDMLNIESAVEMKYGSLSIPSQTNLIIWNFWSAPYHTLLELLQRPWRQVDVFAVYFDWSTLTRM